MKLLVSEIGNANSLDPNRLSALRYLKDDYPLESNQMNRLLELEKQGVHLAEVQKIVSYRRDTRTVVAQMLDDGVSADQFTPAKIADKLFLSRITSRADSYGVDAKEIAALQAQGLSASRLAHYMEESPSRPEIIRRLLSERPT